MIYESGLKNHNKTVEKCPKVTTNLQSILNTSLPFTIFALFKNITMEAWQFDFEWLQIQHKVQAILDQEKLPNLNGVLFLIGIQELGQLKEVYTKEEKQDLMHIAICRLLSDEGYFNFKGIDQDGWPHWEPTRDIDVKGLKNQEVLLKTKVIEYFKNI